MAALTTHAALTTAACPGCGHSPFQHHIEGGCTVTSYGLPEDGFQPAVRCTCDETAEDALLASGAVIDAASLARPCVAGREFHDEWIEQLCALIPDGDESRYSNPEGAPESIILDCFRAYAARPDVATLADDEALVRHVALLASGVPQTKSDLTRANAHLRALAAALTERGETS